jgi:Aminoglycoside-2''-adenylyltransferase/2'-5' RNA ligase superfamily
MIYNNRFAKDGRARRDSMHSPAIQPAAPPGRNEPAPPYRPTLAYRVSGTLNRWVWRAPLPRRVVARLSTLVYRNPPMPSELVLSIIDALAAADVRCWIGGGWGVDALVGERTRTHRDLDLVVEEQDTQRAVEVLEELGYWEWYHVDSDVPLFSRVVLHDHELAGRAIDLHPLALARTQVEFTTGTIGGREVPCMSVELQLKTHSNYRKRWRDRADLTRLRRLREGSATTLIVPVPSAGGLLHESSREAGLPAHITILYPFLTNRAVGRDTELALETLLREIPPFEFTLSRVGSFPGVVYLAPEPATPFVAMTQALVERWPDHPPYRGAYEEIVPHLTVAYGDAVPAGLAERLPIGARAEEVWLMGRAGGRWVRRKAFPLGT